MAAEHDFVTEMFVRRLSIPQREILIKHVAGSQPVVLGDNSHQAVLKLIELQLLRFPLNHDRARPRITSLTVAGRAAAAMILGQYADALVAAGCLEGTALRPIDLVELIKDDSQARKLRARPALRISTPRGRFP